MMTMRTLLDRYLAGDHKAVWEELRGLDAVSDEHGQFDDIWSVVRETMRRVRRNLETLIDRLRVDGYEFVDTTYPPLHIGAPLSTPDEKSLAFLNWLADLTGPLPLALRGWIQFVGDVHLLGNHPAWPAREMYTDALVVEFEYRECRDSVNAREHYQRELENWRHWVAEDGIEDVGPFKIEFAPDIYHKVNVSGGPPYSIVVPDNRVDGTVDLGSRQVFFVDYVRDCFTWGGFPGFAEKEAGRDAETVRRLTDGLLPI